MNTLAILHLASLFVAFALCNADTESAASKTAVALVIVSGLALAIVVIA